MNYFIFLNKKVFFLVGLVLIFSVSLIAAVMPYGAGNVTVISTQAAPADSPESVLAQAGNVTELNVFGYTTTQAWQGYFGNVTGTIQLADGNDKVMYNWSLANPQGEVYASTASSVSWSALECFNFSAEGENLEGNFSIDSSDADGVNETFSYNNGHDLFYAGGTEFTEGECMSTRIYDSSGGGVENNFEEVLLWDGDNVIFTSLLEDNLAGFDDATHDFEMIVLEDGHGTDTETTTYYFYVELE